MRKQARKEESAFSLHFSFCFVFMKLSLWRSCLLQEDPRGVPRPESVEQKGKCWGSWLGQSKGEVLWLGRVRLRGLVSWQSESKANVKYAQDSVSGVSIFLPSPPPPVPPNTIELKDPSLSWSLKNENFKELLNATACLPSLAPWVYTQSCLTLFPNPQELMPRALK